MNKIGMLAAAILILTASNVRAEELDDLVRYGLQNSVSGRAVRAAYGSEAVTRRAGYYALIPSLDLGASYDYSGSSGGLTCGVTLSKSFGDVDAAVMAVRTAELNAQIARYSAELGYRNYIDSVITAYVNLAILRMKIGIAEAELGTERMLLKQMQIKFLQNNEIELNVLKQSNDIELSKITIKLQYIDYTNALRSLNGLCGTNGSGYAFRLDVPEPAADLPVDSYALQLKLDYLTLTNLLYSRNSTVRSQFLPNLSLSFSDGWDSETRSANLNFGIGLDYSVLDIFDRANTVRGYDVQIASQLKTIDADGRDYAKALASYEASSSAYREQVGYLQRNLDIEKKLDELNFYKYQTDQIDYYNYMLLRDDLLTAELNLLEARSEWFLLVVRRNYGIISE